ncbi:hypothetical protein Q4485_13705 [Granulosicoccaceae sp. 1_MG-2023]|nr:hypothetical protein [Granulosicoccaceae sp. 1_MG-2023]
MNVLPGVLPSAVMWAAGLLFVLLMAQAARTAPWYKILDNESSHVFLGSVLLVGIIWLVRSSVFNGINFHLLASTALMVMFDWQFALFAVLLVHAGLYVLGAMPLSVIPLNVLICGAIPIFLTRAGLILAFRRLPHNFFIFVFLNCFLAAGLSMIAVALTTLGLYYFFAYESVYLNLQDFLPFTLMLAFPEAVLNGIVLSGLIAYQPGWIATFHDRFYIVGK